MYSLPLTEEIPCRDCENVLRFPCAKTTDIPGLLYRKIMSNLPYPNDGLEHTSARSILRMVSSK